MTTNYHTDIATGAPLNASTFNNPMGELDAALTGIVSGVTSLTQLNLGTDSTLTIASGAITVTRSRHLIDTEGSAATDDLTTINGGAEGDVLLLQIVSNSRVVTIKNSGNIYLRSGTDIKLDNVYEVIAFLYDGTEWNEIGLSLAVKLSNYNSFVVPDTKTAFAPAMQARNRWDVKAAAATVQATGIAAPTATGTPSASNDTDSTYINLLSGAVSGNLTGYVSATFNLVRRSHNPTFHCILRTGAAADIANIRYWVGLFSAAPTNVDTLAAGTKAICFRSSTVAGDSGWVGVCSDGTTQTVSAGSGALTASTRYLLSFEVDSTNSLVRFSVDNGDPVTVSANLPATTDELGFAVYLITTAAVAKNFKLSRLVCTYD